MPRGGKRGPRLDRTPTLEAITVSERLGCAFIMLGHGRFTLVDKEDAIRVQPFVWYHQKVGYAATNIIVNQKRTPVTLHSFLMPPSPGMEVDHRNRNTLDNRRQNLRIATKANNAANSPKRKLRTLPSSRFKGVRRVGRKFAARGMVDGSEHYLGVFANEVDAASAYNAWASKHFGEFAFLNPV